MELTTLFNDFIGDADTPEKERPSLVTSSFCIQLVLGTIFLFCGFLVSPYLAQLFKVEQLSVDVSWVSIFAIFSITALGIWHGYMLDVTRLHLKP